jgi:hypothetical protein
MACDLYLNKDIYNEFLEGNMLTQNESVHVKRCSFWYWYLKIILNIFIYHTMKFFYSEKKISN